MTAPLGISTPFAQKAVGETEVKLRLSCPDCGWTVRVPGFIAGDGSGGFFVRAAEEFPDHPEPSTCAGTTDIAAEFYAPIITTTPAYHVKITL